MLSSLGRGGYRIPLVFAVVVLAVVCLLRVQHARAATGITVDASVSTHQSSPATSITSGAISTTNPGDLLVAFMASDGPAASGGQSFSSVAGGGLTWKLRERTNNQPGTAEIWEAVAPTALSNVTVTATRSSGSHVGAINVVAFRGASTTSDGAVGSGNATTGAPTVSLTSTQAGSWVWGIGDDWDNAKARTVGSGQTLFDQFLASVGDTYWVQSQASAGNAANTPVTLNDTAPTTDHYDFSAIEIIPGTPDTQPPTAPSNLQASAPNSNEVDLSWSPSTDNVAVAGYDILRNGTQIGTSTSTTYQDLTVAPSTPYSYTVEAYDAAGNISPPSNTATITTPAASTNPPVISNVQASGITTTSATITWTTDIPSSSQVFYGTTSSYNQSTTLNAAQVTSHSQTITGLSVDTTYHFEVQSSGKVNNTGTSSDNTFTTANDVTLPDMQILVPTADFSIGTNPNNGDRQLQYEHITWDSGTGPFEIDPTYNSATGTATFSQEIYKSDSPGVWTKDYSVPLAVTGSYNAQEQHYSFPLTQFTLHTVNPDGSIGSVVATSPKTDYCITGDTYVGGVPNAPNQTSPPVSNCANPGDALGWSVGWGDEYDQTDPGQPIDLTNVPDGTYILRGVVDPDHMFTESNPSDNVTDTEIQISGSTVKVLSQSNPVVNPPSVTMTSPAAGSGASGTVALQASAAAVSPATVASVQFLLDGVPIGSPVSSAPYAYSWIVGNTSLGNHTLSARVTDSNGTVATAAPVTVDVVSVGGQPGNPAVTITNPATNETVSGTISVTAAATDNGPISSVQFFLDGQALGSAVTSSPYTISWDTTTATAGSHTLTAKVTDSGGNTATSSPVTVIVQNPIDMTCFVKQAQESVHGKGTVTTAAFHTAMGGETLLAFVASDGPGGSGKQTATVSGAGLTWTLVKRENARSGDSEIWQAAAPSVLTSATVTSTPAKGGYAQDLTVIAYEGTKGVGASAVASGASGAPTLSLTTTAPQSLVFAVGNDWDSATPRTLPAGWTMLDEWTNASSGDDYWIQYTSDPTGPTGSAVNVNDTAPTNDQWNLVAVELLDDGS